MKGKVFILMTLLSILALSCVSALTDTITTSWTTDAVTNGVNGILFYPRQNVQLYQVERATLDQNTTNVSLKDNNGVLIQLQQFNQGVGNQNASFSGYNLRANTPYRLECAGNGLVRINNTALSFPLNKADIIVQGASSNGANATSNLQVYCIQSVTSIPLNATSVNLIAPITGITNSNSTLNFTSQIFAANNYTQTLTNATLYIWNSSGSIVVTNTSTISGTFNNSEFIIGNVSSGNYSWNVLGCGTNATATSCKFADANNTFVYGYTINAESYNTNVFVGNSYLFQLNYTLPAGDQVSSATLWWNNTAYPTGTTNPSGQLYSSTKNLVIPQTPSGATVNFNWAITLTSGFSFNSSSHSQTVNGILLDNCSTFTQPILNFTLWDEDSRSSLNGTTEVIVNLFNSDRSILAGSFNQSYTMISNKGATVCINVLNATYSMDYQAKYYVNSTYEVEYKFAQAIPVSNMTSVQNIPLYDLLSSRSTAFTITLQNPDLSVIAGAVVDVQRQYVPINQFISVESVLTDTLGASTAHLVPEQIYYNFVVTKNGVLLGTFNNYQVKCQNAVTSDCRIDLNLVQSIPKIPSFQNYGNLTSSFTWSPSTRTLYYNFISSDNLVHNVSWTVLKADNWGNTTICTASSTSTIGTYQCVIPTIYGNSSIIARLYSDSNYIGSSGFALGPNSNSIFGGTGVILGILMYCTLTLLMISHPVMMILGSFMGLGFMTAFHIADGGTLLGNTSIVLWFFIAGFIIIYHMRNKT